MRLWSLHPSLLDRQGLIAAWREALLAQKVLLNLTRGYRNHPQLERFTAVADPVQAIATFLHGLADDADARGYNFDRQRINLPADDTVVTVSQGQVEYEWQHLLAKLAQRSPEQWADLKDSKPFVHPMMRLVPGPVAEWERPS